MTANVFTLKPKTASEKKTRTVVDTIRFTPETLKNWKLPEFQRDVKVNEKVRVLAEQLKEDGGVMPGIITLGVVDGVTYLIDGQHRREAFAISGLEEGFTDVRIHYFNSMADAGEEFVKLNSQLVRMRPDDILRGLENSVPALREIRRKCPFVGYDMIRRGERAPIVSMSMILRAWRGSSTEVPAPHGVAASAKSLAETLTAEEMHGLIGFLTCAIEGIGRDPEYTRLWGGLNIVLCMWLYRRTVISQWSPQTPRLTQALFAKYLMSLSANEKYMDWLVGRHLGERDRSPAYFKLKSIFAERLQSEMNKKIRMPSPAWCTHGGGAKK
jgi:hypothetical protein